jgi:hypothetical protein
LEVFLVRLTRPQKTPKREQRTPRKGSSILRAQDCSTATVMSDKMTGQTRVNYETATIM